MVSGCHSSAKVCFKAFGVPFWATVLITLALIWVYTYRGGIKTIVIANTIQTVAMLLAVVLTIYTIGQSMGYNFVGTFEAVYQSDYSQMFSLKRLGRRSQQLFQTIFQRCFDSLGDDRLGSRHDAKDLSCKSLKDAQEYVCFQCDFGFRQFAFPFRLVHYYMSLCLKYRIGNSIEN
ncbi:MAG: hypothetical protein R2769_15340 [Saprospiraceae bacterium]